MTECIVCGKECSDPLKYRVLKVMGYREEEREEKKDDLAMASSVTRRFKEKQVLLQGPGDVMEGGVCSPCLRKGRKNSYIGIGISLLILLALLIGYLFLQGIPGIFIQIGLFLSLILLVIFILPFFRNKHVEKADHFFLEIRAKKDEPVISVQDLPYYYGRKADHWLMMRQSHWEELDQEDTYKVLGFL